MDYCVKQKANVMIRIVMLQLVNAYCKTLLLHDAEVLWC